MKALLGFWTVAVLSVAALLFSFFHVMWMREAMGSNAITWVVLGVLAIVLVFPPVVLTIIWRKGSRFNSQDVLVHVVPYFILILALFSSGLPEHLPNQTQERFETIKELAAILLLYALAEMAAFVATWLEGIKNQAEHSVEALNSARDAIVDAQKSIEVENKIGKLHPELREPITRLLQEYAKLAPRTGDKPTDRTEMQDLCLRTLLANYLEEEVRDVRADLKAHEVPPSVLLDRVLEEDSREERENGGGRSAALSREVSYFATNVSFYVRLLNKEIDVLISRPDHAERLCLAIITNVLPAHWWNYPVEEGYWYEYPPVERYRKALSRVVLDPLNPAQVDRIILVDNESGGSSSAQPEAKELFQRRSALWSESLANNMASWKIHFKEREGPYLTSLDSDMADIGDAVHVQSGIVGRAGEREIFLYKMFGPAKNKAGGQPLLDKYLQDLHGTNGGSSWYLPIADDVFHNSAVGFSGCHDIMFLGRSKMPKFGGYGLWSSECAEMNWDVGFLASMSPGSETMFLSAIRGATLDAAWKRFHQRVSDNHGRLKLLVPSQPAAAVPPPAGGARSTARGAP
jgi:hypothetical protein